MATIESKGKKVQLLGKCPKFPRRPVPPTEPQKFLPTWNIVAYLSDGDSLGEVLKDFTGDVRDLRVDFERDYDPYSHDASFIVKLYSTKPIENKNYDKQLKAYKAALETFAEEQKVFEEDSKIYNEWQERKAVENARKLLKKVGNKYD